MKTQARLGMSSVRAMKYARRDLVAIGAMHHSDFTSFAMVPDRFLPPIDPKYAGTHWDRRTGRHGHETTARLILALLFETLKADPMAVRFSARLNWRPQTPVSDPPTVNGPSPSGPRESGHGHDRSTPAPARVGVSLNRLNSPSNKSRVFSAVGGRALAGYSFL